MPWIPNHIDAEIIMLDNQLKEDLFQKADHRTVPSRNTGLYRAPPSAVRRSAGANEKGLTGTLAALVQVCIWLPLGLLGTPRYPQTLKSKISRQLNGFLFLRRLTVNPSKSSQSAFLAPYL